MTTIDKESTIRWQTGKPEIAGRYIVSDCHNGIDVDVWNGSRWLFIPECVITAWCNLSDIEPYHKDEV